MAVKLSSWLWIRNSNILPVLENPYNETGRYMNPEGKAELARIVEEMDGITSFDLSATDEPLLGPNVVLSGYQEVVQKTSDLKKYGDLLERVHGVMRDVFVDPTFYRMLGEAFAECGARPRGETKAAIDYGTKHEYDWNGFGYRGRRMNWASSMRSQKMEALEETAKMVQGGKYRY